MATKIRLQRLGNHKRPFYRIVSMESRNKRDGKFLEILGTYEPFRNLIDVDLDKVKKWLSFGSQKTKTVTNLLKRAKKQKNINLK